MTPSFLNELLVLLDGLGRTLLISGIGIALGMALGMAMGAARHARIPVLSQLIACYANLFRCTPLLVQVVMLYFALPDLGIKLTPFETSWLALGLWGAAYHTEIFRAGFGSVNPDEVLAARALGMSAPRSFLDITVPLGTRAAIPAATTMAITQFRSSSFMIAVGYQELTYVANRMVADTFKVFQVFGIAALAYLIVSNVIAMASRRLEKTVAVPGLGAVK
ncbi:amino acid ABC transporter permease [Variovorax fucosicus]|uniref:amino acid ABC transporter permease n=1 Tax=Variovorax fucosicus TaxID=3053517 RepID=UPI00257516E3|nr:amino acid ABC transporter permease [Variovorax sp. J22G47]MDM0058948.1 amino acid ABC transporter permease [Variovorax sp. J22G47]